VAPEVSLCLHQLSIRGNLDGRSLGGHCSLKLLSLSALLFVVLISL
jgi:hypothetical protein